MSISEVDMNESTFGNLSGKDLRMKIDEFDGDTMSLSQSGQGSAFVEISKQDSTFCFKSNLNMSVIPGSFDNIKGTTEDQRYFLFQAENALNNQIKPRRTGKREATEKKVAEDAEQTQT